MVGDTGLEPMTSPCEGSALPAAPIAHDPGVENRYYRNEPAVLDHTH